MCRLYGQRSRLPATAEELLCSGHNALRFQSHRHPHGWGVAWFDGMTPQLVRGVLPAHADEAFYDAAAHARSRVVVAHVRDASVGEPAPRNSHPFHHGRWVFAHNGTVARFRSDERVRARLEAEIDPDLRVAISGETDSERLFYLFLTRLRGHARLGVPAAVPAVRAALAATTATVQACADDRSHRSSLNFLVSDGRLLAACRRGRDLVFHRSPGPAGRLVVASERIGHAGWRAVPEGGFVAVDDHLRLTAGPLDARPRRAARPARPRPAPSRPAR